MAVDAYMTFTTYDGNSLAAESQVDFSKQSSDLKEASGKFKAGFVFEISDYNFDIEQTLNIGSASKGTGAGRVTFNPFSFTRKIDQASPKFFGMACSGTPFKEILLGLRKASGGDTTGSFFLMYRFVMAAVKTVSWAHDEESPNETVTFEYGGLQIFYGIQKADGTINQSSIPAGWDRMKNIANVSPDFTIAAT